MLTSILYFLYLIPCCFAFGWAGWSPWTPCSKTCGGGVSQQLRRCLDAKCSGLSVRFRVCETKDCDKPSRSARDTVCSGEIIVSKQQCEVVCRSRSTGSRFLWRMADGTPCQAPSNRAVCSHGTCQIVGCDDVIGSSLRFDACGICGGRGDACDNAQFVWRQSGEFTPCASSCDDVFRDFHGGRDIRESHSVSVCTNVNTGRVVPERLCADRPKPKGISRECPPLICPSSWLASDWSECLPSCGGGIRTRVVYCVQHTFNHTINVPEKFCTNQTKPTSEESCSSESCGHWEAGRWSSCSASCGQGTRRRSVECVGGVDCEPSSRPPSEAVCYTGQPCQIGSPDSPQAWTMAENSLDWSDRRFLDGASYNPMETIGTAPRVVPSSWTDCSTTCGPGVETRSVECMALHPITANMIKLPYSECQSLPQPTLYQSCEVRPCPLQEDSKIQVDSAPFSWQHGEWGPCSATCLGGKQKAALKCFERATGRAVQWSQCDARTRPPEKLRQCNQQACPPLWQVGPYAPCTSSCGGGTNTRAVKCVRPVSRSGGADAHIVLPDADCPLPKPPDSQQCAATPCPANWITGEWTECSASCGSGEQRRRVSCEGRDARGRRERRAEKECAGDKPVSVQMCSLGSCDKPQLLSNRIFEQNASLKKLTLSLGGIAYVYQGTSVKIKCPSKNFDKKKIVWTKNGKKLRNDAHIKVSTNGNLRIFHARLEDAGVYECYTNANQGNITLKFKYDDKAQRQYVTTNRIDGGMSKPSKFPNATFIQALLSSTNEEEVARELSKYKDQIDAQWDIGHWTDCKQSTCGVAGYQARSVGCTVSIEGHRKQADGTICSTLAGVRPPETRPCHREDCPRWEASDWTECVTSRCIRDSISQQKRHIRCLLSNGTELDQDRCDRTSKPKTKKECQNPSCKAEWHSSAWGSCSSNCGTGGVQLRLLSCVWSSTGKAAGRSCEGTRRPSAARACVTDEVLPSCPVTPLPLMQDASCEDNSRFCDIIKLFHSCDSAEVRQKCCSTCRYMEKKRV